MSTSEGKCVLVEVGALINWCIYSYRIVMLLVPYMWASMTFLPKNAHSRAIIANYKYYANSTTCILLFIQHRVFLIAQKHYLQIFGRLLAT